MNQVVVTTKLDPETKKEAQKIAEELGLPLSVIIKAFLKQFIRTKSVSFSARDEDPSEYLQRVMRQARENYKKGKHSPVFTSGEEAVDWLDKQGI